MKRTGILFLSSRRASLHNLRDARSLFLHHSDTDTKTSDTPTHCHVRSIVLPDNAESSACEGSFRCAAEWDLKISNFEIADPFEVQEFKAIKRPRGFSTFPTDR